MERLKSHARAAFVRTPFVALQYKLAEGDSRKGQVESRTWGWQRGGKGMGRGRIAERSEIRGVPLFIASEESR